MVEGGHSGQEHQEGLLDEGVPAASVLQDVLTELIKVPEHELPAHMTGDKLHFHPLAAGKALHKPWETTDRGSTRREVGARQT